MGDTADATVSDNRVELRPLFVRGLVQIVDEDGRLIREDTRGALCRRGASENKPFCGGGHRRIGFSTAS